MPLRPNINGTAQNSFQIGFSGPVIYSGTADPTVSGPNPPSGTVVKNGDLYVRLLGGAEAIWIYESGTWTEQPTGGRGGTFGGDVTVDGSLQVTGDLIVSGTTTTVDTTNLAIKDALVLVNDGEAGSGVTLGFAGIEVDRGLLDNAFWRFNEAQDRWEPSGTGTENLRVNGTISTTTFNITGSSSGTIVVQGQAAAGSYNFNLPITAGLVGQALVSGGGGSNPMTWVTHVTSINVSGGTTGLSFTGGPITSTGTITMSGTLGATNGGTGQSTWTLGDILYSNGSNTLTKLAGNTTTTKKYLAQTGNGTISAAPVWATPLLSDIAPPGADTQVIFNNAGGFGADAGFTFNSGTGAVTISGNLGAASVNKVVVTAPATTATLTIANNKTVTISNTLTFTGTDTSSIAFGGGGTVAYTTNNLGAFASTTSAQLRGVLSDETGTGLAVFNDTPTLIAPAIGDATGNTLILAQYIRIGATNSFGFNGRSEIYSPSNGIVQFLNNSGSGFGALQLFDSYIYRDALNTIALQNGVNPNEFRVYRTTNGTDYERISIGWSGTTAQIAAQAGGTGSVQPLNFVASNFQFNGSGVSFGSGGTVAFTGGDLSQFAATTSAQLRGVLSDETGTGVAVFATSPTLVTPILGVATATSINKVAITAPATSATLTIIDGKTFTVNNTLTFSGTDTSSIAFGGGGTVAYVANNLSVFASTTSAQLRGVLSDETGTGVAVFNDTPTLITPILGTPTSGTLTNCTGLPISTGVSGLGTGIATFLATPSSANLAAAVTGETGTGALVFANSPSLTSPALTTPSLGTPSSGTLTNCSGLPISTGVSGLGTGIATFLATPSSANLAAAVTDETGSGSLVFGTSPTLTTPNLSGLPTGTGVASAANSGTLMSRDSNANTAINNIQTGYATTATAAGTTTLTVSSARQQFFTGTSTQNCDLPVTSTLALGFEFEITNNSTGAVTIRSSGGNTVVVLPASNTAILTCILTSGTSASSWSIRYINNKGPTTQTFTSGSGTYNTPAGVKWIRVRLVGGGGGGQGSGTTPGNGGAGGNSTFSTFTANGGSGGASGSGGAGGTGSGGFFTIPGGRGGDRRTGYTFEAGGLGGGSVFGQSVYNAASGGDSNTSQTPAANSGAGGSGGAADATADPGAGGGGGAYVEGVINSPAASYSYAVGGAGTAGTIGGGTNPRAGSPGAAGIVIVEEYYS